MARQQPGRRGNVLHGALQEEGLSKMCLRIRFAALLACLLCAQTVTGAPIEVELPAYALWCAKGIASQDDLKSITGQATLFAKAEGPLQDSAKAAGVGSMGIPF